MLSDTDLRKDPRRTLARVFDFIGIRFDSSILDEMSKLTDSQLGAMYVWKLFHSV